MSSELASVLAEMPTLYSGHCCNLKIEAEDRRVFLCRVGGGVTVERLIDGRWVTVEGGCMVGGSDG